MNPQQLLEIFPLAQAARAETYAPILTATMQEFEIDTPMRAAAFLAQTGWESSQLRHTVELGADDYFAKYEGRLDLGNTQTGDGLRFKGRGLIQITGRANYRAAGMALGVDLLSDPERLAEPELAARSAGWFWKANALNRYADSNQFGSLTKRVNGGFTHIDERIQLWLVARRVLNVA
jgi:putative chitinase